MALPLLPVSVFAQTPTYSSYVVVAGTVLSDGKYYYTSGGNIYMLSPEESVPSSYVIYNKSNGTLTLCNAEIATSSTYGLTVAQDEIQTSGELTVNLIGANTLRVTGPAGGIYADKMDCKITGNGSLKVYSESMSAIQVRSLTVNDNITLDVCTDATNDSFNAIETIYDVLLNNGTFNIRANKGNAGIISSYGNITVSGNADVQNIFGNKNGVHCSRGKLTVGGKNFDAEANMYYAAWASDVVLKSGKISFICNQGNAIGVGNSVQICKDAVVNATAKSSYPAIYSADSILVSGGKLSAFSAGSNGLYAKSITMNDGEAEVVSYYPALWAENAVKILDGTLNATSTADSAIYSKTSTIEIGGANVTASGYYCALYGTMGVNIFGADLTANSSDDCAVFSPQKVIISDNSNVSAKGLYAAIRGNKGIKIDGNVTAVSNVSSAFQTNMSENDNEGNLEITGGTVVAVTKNQSNNFSINIGGDVIVNGDAVVYLNDSKDFTREMNYIKGIVFEQTDVTFDEEGNVVLAQGKGTVYGNPNVTDFVMPKNSVLGTALDEYVKIETADVTYSAGKAEPKPVVKVEKTVLTKTLTEHEDYIVNDSLDSTKDVGEKTFEIVAQKGSGNVGSREFKFNVIPAQLTLDARNVTVSRFENGSTQAAAAVGKPMLKGIKGNDDVSLTYTNIDVPEFPSAMPGAYSMELTIMGSGLAGEDGGNYVLSSNKTDVMAVINCAAKDENNNHRCDYCDAVVTEHRMFFNPAHDADCVNDGNTAYYYCEICNKYYSDNQGENEISLADTVIKKTDHNYENGECTDCGKEDPDECFVLKFFRRIIKWFTELFENISKWFK